MQPRPHHEFDSDCVHLRRWHTKQLAAGRFFPSTREKNYRKSEARLCHSLPHLPFWEDLESESTLFAVVPWVEEGFVRCACRRYSVAARISLPSQKTSGPSKVPPVILLYPAGRLLWADHRVVHENRNEPTRRAREKKGGCQKKSTRNGTAVPPYALWWRRRATARLP